MPDGTKYEVWIEKQEPFQDETDNHDPEKEEEE
jgi:hypothetical protein